MIAELLTQLEQAAPSYIVTYEEAQMANVVADSVQREKGFIYLEEYRQGQYVESYGLQKTTKVDIYFCRFATLHSTAMERETIRTQIEEEAVLPFLRKWVESHSIYGSGIPFYCQVPRFDANEVSIRLTLQVTEDLC